jgi:glycerol-3-phosphate dehydrogenase (NAD(P)+)
MAMRSLDTMGVIGAGAWGIALANAASRAGRNVVLYGRNAAQIETLRETRESTKLPGAKLAEGIVVTNDLGEASRANAMLLAVPAQELRAAATALASRLSSRTALIACAKGIERGTQKFMTDVIGEAAPGMVPAILSGPSFAIDVASGLPTAVTLASTDNVMAIALARALGSATFRPYHATDVRGVEIGGAAKNVLAIAAGIVAGKKLGASALAALTTRGFVELVRFGRALDAKAETLTGLSGLGDLILTCSSPQSRNFAYGAALGRGETPPNKLAEGAYTAQVLADMASAKDIDMPITHAVAAILAGKLGIDEAIEMLLTRPIKAE